MLTKQKTYYPKVDDNKAEWLLIDAEGEVLGRLASRIAVLLRGKHRASFTPSVISGDYIIVINAEKINFTGRKGTQKIYYHHTGYPHGLRSESLEHRLARKPESVIMLAVKRMLRRSSLSAKLMTRLKIYSGADHPHMAQKPKKMSVSK